jgi:hypothetical protein
VQRSRRHSKTLGSAYSSARKSLRRGRRCSTRRKVPLDQRERARQVLRIYRFSRYANTRFTRSFSLPGRSSDHYTDSRTSPASHRIAARHHARAANEQDRFFQDVELLRQGIVSSTRSSYAGWLYLHLDRFTNRRIALEGTIIGCFLGRCTLRSNAISNQCNGRSFFECLGSLTHRAGAQTSLPSKR